MPKTPYYITTAIAYASQRPHIGNCYDIVLADAIARYKRMQGYDVYFQTGTDEHGQKVEHLAAEKGVTPQVYVDGVTAQVKAEWDCLNTSYDYFIRATDPAHKARVQRLFQRLYDQGDIYKGRYEGKYCVPCESFFTASQLTDGKCPDCGREVADASEDAYFFRLSKYADRLLAWYEQQPGFFQPGSRKAEMVNNFLKPGLADLCVTRSTFTWGIPVPFDPGHVIYVWMDALFNYATSLGYGDEVPGERYDRFWPADLHVIGKDIVRFHTVYWPIFLMALGVELPRQVLGHPWLLFSGDKMSKSKGNILYAGDLTRRFGTDAVRYYLLSQIPFAQDGSITLESFVQVYNTDLANTLGNLVNRTVSMTAQYFGGAVTRPADFGTAPDPALLAACEQAQTAYRRHMDALHNADAIGEVWELARRCNKYIDETTPWALAKDDAQRERLNAVLYNLLECIRAIGVLLLPFLPETAAKMQAQLGAPDGLFTLESLACYAAPDGFTVGQAQPLFARLDAAKVLAEAAAEAAAAQPSPPPAETPAPPFLPEIAFDDFARLDLRAAKVLDCAPIPKAKKLLRLTLDDGSGVPRTVCSGIAKWYTPEQLTGRTVVLVANLKPAVLCGVESRGMILAADVMGSDDDAAQVLFVDGIAPGSKIR